MAQTILSSATSAAAFSLTRKDTGLEIASNWKISKVSIRYRSIVMRHMREDGTSIVDARVIVPTSAEVYVICPTIDDVKALEDFASNRGTLYKMLSKGLVVDNVFCESSNLKQSSEMISATPVRLSLSSILIQGQAIEAVEQGADSSTIARGIQTLQSSADDVATAFESFITSILAAA